MNPIPLQESLTCEFKSDRQCLSDKDLIEAVVCMANGQGGEIFLGVEDDGRITPDQAYKLFIALCDNNISKNKELTNYRTVLALDIYPPWRISGG
jgi:predicted HTH transcriptional regulator